jgi:MFS family permease
VARLEEQGVGLPLSAPATVDGAASIESRRSWQVALAAMFCLVFGPSTILVTGFGVFVGPIAKEGGWSPGQVALAISFTALMVMVVTPVQGILTDRFGSRRVVLVSMPLFVAGLAAMSLAPRNLTLFYLMWACLPILGIGLWPTAYLKAVGSWFDRHLGVALGIANSGFGMGAMLVPLIAGGLIGVYGWRMAFVGLAGFALLTLPVAFLFLRENAFVRPGMPAPTAVGTGAAESGPLLKDPLFRKLCIGYALIGFAGTGFAVNLVSMSVHNGASTREAVALQAIYGATALFGRLFAGWLLDRVFAARVMSAIVIGACLACAVFIAGATGWPAILGAVFHGLLLGAEFDVLAYVVRRNYPMARFGKIYGVVFALFQAGASLGAAFLAMSAQQTGSYAIGMTGYAIALGLSLFVFTRLEPYRIAIPVRH